jgi:hypothetical protein
LILKLFIQIEIWLVQKSDSFYFPQLFLLKKIYGRPPSKTAIRSKGVGVRGLTTASANRGLDDSRG